MNFTFFSLSVNKINSLSPFFSISANSAEKNYKFKQIQISKSLSNFLYSSAKSPFISFNRCNFNKFMETALYFDKETISKQEIALHIDTKEANVDIDFCTFSNCISNSDGGSVHLNTECFLQCKNSKFIHSESMRNGGAISGLVIGMNITKCCFMFCTAQTAGQSLNIRHRESNNGLIEESTFVYCCPKDKKVNSESLIIQQGKLTFSFNNHSNNIVARGSGAVTVQQGVASLFSYSHICNNTGSKILDFFFMTQPVRITNINFINNEVPSRMVLLSFSYTATVENSYFQGNKGYLTSRSPGMPHTITFIHCMYDKIEFSLNVDITTTECSLIGHRDFPLSVGPHNPVCGDDQSVIDHVLAKGSSIYIFLFLAVFILLIVFIIMRGNCLTQFVALLPGRRGRHVRSRPVIRG